MAEMTCADFARTMGMHRSRVPDWCTQGLPVLPSGNVDPVAAAAWVHRHIDPTARLRHARQAARGASEPPNKPVPPLGREHLIDPVDAALVTVLPMLAIGIAPAVTSLAIATGASCAVAYTAPFTAPTTPYIGSETGLLALYHLDGDGSEVASIVDQIVAAAHNSNTQRGVLGMGRMLPVIVPGLDTVSGSCSVAGAFGLALSGGHGSS